MRKNTNSQKGFSLLEVLIASAVFAVIVTAALLMYDRSNRVFKTGVENSNLQQNTRVAFEQMMSDVRMAGFDFDRDGIPGGTNQHQQPDEQVEYIGRNAITIRGNFDYETARLPCTADPANPVECDNGRERAYEPTTGQFPLVTTGNDEIVTYALQSRNTAMNTGTITFYADTAVPRHTYPTGQIEDTVTITGVDLTNDNPPYTLYRYTLDTAGALVSTPIADNIRSLDFLYYEDTTGTTLLKSLDSTPVTYTPAQYATSVGGQGQYDPSNTTLQLPARNVRSKIQSVRVTLVGMNEAPDGTYTDPTETVASVRNYRKFRLNSLVIPRNAGRRGTVEQEYRAPSAPSITRICYGYCGMVYIEWEAPTGGNSGAPDQYAVLYNTSSSGGFSNIEYVGNTLSAYVALPDPSASYYFAVEAINSYGAAVSGMEPASAGPGISVRNATTPGVPTNLSASGAGGIPVQENQITLRWKAPTAAAGGAPSCTTGSAPAVLPSAEIKGWRIERRRVGSTTWQQVINENATGTGAPNFNIFTGDVTWADTTAANCVDWEYHIATVERCPNAAQNVSPQTGVSAWSATIQGRAESNVQPKASTALAPVLASSSCPPLAAAAGNCSITLRWNAVQQNILDQPIGVDTYRIKRTRKDFNDTTFAEVLTDVVINSATTGATFGTTDVTYLDTVQFASSSDPLPGGAASRNYHIEYQVIAEQCTAPPSAPSPTAKYPCAYNAGVLSAAITPSSSVIQGNGSSANPFMIDSPVGIAVSSTGAMSGLQAVFISSGGTSTVLGNIAAPPTFTTATFNLPTLTSGDSGRVVLTATDGQGCTTSLVYYVTESGSNCCLTPTDLEATLEFVDPSVDAAFYRLRNICTEQLEIKQVTVHWNTGYVTNNPNPRANIGFPAAIGGAVNPATLTYVDADNNGSTATPVTYSRPTGTVQFLPTDAAGTADDYWVRIKFTRDFSASSQNPVRGICIVYRRASDTADRICRIDPTPAATPDTCPAP